MGITVGNSLGSTKRDMLGTKVGLLLGPRAGVVLSSAIRKSIGAKVGDCVVALGESSGVGMSCGFLYVSLTAPFRL